MINLKIKKGIKKLKIKRNKKGIKKREISPFFIFK